MPEAQRELVRADAAGVERSFHVQVWVEQMGMDVTQDSEHPARQRRVYACFKLGAEASKLLFDEALLVQKSHGGEALRGRKR